MIPTLKLSFQQLKCKIKYPNNILTVSGMFRSLRPCFHPANLLQTANGVNVHTNGLHIYNIHIPYENTRIYVPNRLQQYFAVAKLACSMFNCRARKRTNSTFHVVARLSSFSCGCRRSPCFARRVFCVVRELASTIENMLNIFLNVHKTAMGGNGAICKF